jgi:outer membrane protein assembly factor BamA
LPTRGVLGGLHGSLGLSPLGSSYNYGKLEAHIASWWQLPWDHVVSVQAEIGVIAGDPPFFEKFYVGDYTDLLPDRILGLSPDRRQPPNIMGTDIAEVRYGDYAARLAAEYRIPLYRGHGSVYGIDSFVGAGLYGAATKRELDDPPSGYQGAERIPIDFTYNLGLRIETYVGGFSIAFSNLFGLLPAQGGGRK